MGEEGVGKEEEEEEEGVGVGGGGWQEMGNTWDFANAWILLM